MNGWTSLLNQAIANTHINAMALKPKAEDWFMLRDRWNKYPESQRKFYLSIVLGRYVLTQNQQGKAVDPEVITTLTLGVSRRLEEFSDTDKRAIAMAIMDSERYSKLDNALISGQRAVKKRINQPDDRT